MILHQVESLAAAGVTDIVLAVNYRPDIMVSALKKVRIFIPSTNNSKRTDKCVGLV
jgi:NDP-sugar pyrophosphorylase family protein